jgi:hypothetical protein
METICFSESSVFTYESNVVKPQKNDMIIPIVVRISNVTNYVLFIGFFLERDHYICSLFNDAFSSLDYIASNKGKGW